MADPGSDLIDTERFREASGRSNGPLRRKDQKSERKEAQFWAMKRIE